MNGKKLLTIIAISTMLLTGCSFGSKNTIVKVNEQNITKSQFDKLMNEEASNSMFAQMGMNINEDKNSFFYLMIKDKVVNELIIKALIDQEVEKRNIKVTKEDTDKELKSIIDQIGSKEKFDEILKQNGISSAKLKSDLIEEVKIKKLISMISTINVKDSDAKKFYNKNINKFKYPDKVRASHILISANPEEIKQKLMSIPTNKGLSKTEIQKMINEELATKLQKAKNILAEVKKDPGNFSSIAIENSDDTASSKQGGDLGFFAKKEMVEPFSKVAFSLKPNTISDVVQSPYGYHIILVKDRKKQGIEPFEKVKPEIIAYLNNQKQVEAMNKLIESLKKQAKIVYVNPEFNPENIQNALRQQAKNNPVANEELNPSSQSATPEPIKK